MKYSENYDFVLPEDEDGYDIAPMSENFETLDGILTENETAMEEISAKIGTPTESDQTLFSLLGNSGGTGLTAIKSIQRVTYKADKGTTDSIAINEIVPENTLVIFERLGDPTNGGCNRLEYTLNSTNISFDCSSFSSGSFYFGFWVIEFC